MSYFSYSPDDGFMRHETAEQAKAQAEKELQLYAEEANSDGWAEDVDQICWGKVVERATQINHRKADEGDGGDTFDYCDYKLAEQPDENALATSVEQNGIFLLYNGLHC